MERQVTTLASHLVNMGYTDALDTNFGPASTSTHGSKEAASLPDGRLVEASTSLVSASAGAVEAKGATNGVSLANRTRPTPKPKPSRDPIGTPARPERAATSPRGGGPSSFQSSKAKQSSNGRQAFKGRNPSSQYGSPPTSSPAPSGPEHTNRLVSHPQSDNAPALQSASEGTSPPPNGGSDVSSKATETDQAAVRDSPLASPNVEGVAVRSGGSDTLRNAGQATMNDSSFKAPPSIKLIKPCSNSEPAPSASQETIQEPILHPAPPPPPPPPPPAGSQLSVSQEPTASTSSSSQQISTSASYTGTNISLPLPVATENSSSLNHSSVKVPSRFEETLVAEFTHPLQPSQENPGGLEPPGTETYDVIGYPSISVAPIQEPTVSPLSRKEVERAMAVRHKQDAKFSIDIRTLADPQSRRSIAVSADHTILELYTLLFFEFNAHPEQACLYWQGKALDLLPNSAISLQDAGITQGSTLILSRSCPGAFVELLKSQSDEGRIMKEGSKLIAHRVLSPSEIRCSDSQERTVTVDLKHVQITNMFKHSFAEEVVSVSGLRPPPVVSAPVRSESVYLEREKPRGYLAVLLGCCGLLRKPAPVIKAPLYLPPWSTDTAQATSVPPPANAGDPHFLLKEEFGPSTVAFEVRSPPLSSSSARPSIAIAVKCFSHGDERVSFITLKALLPEKDRISGVSPEELLGPVDAAAVSSNHAQSRAAGIDAGVGWDGVKLGGHLKQTDRHEVAQTFAGRAQRRTVGAVLGHSEAVWTMKENPNRLEGLPIQTHLTMEFRSKPRTVFLSYRIEVAKRDGQMIERESAACFLFP
ncbi:hypothetical protein BKA70DRAFT_837913 [Coprinopsis sp. MPI-PUGE-AT-0042]|nr:hypothetical protein BKA70DRAFT_837913 [Coprinopsis sp. MPI-PUGE-AT-0042]